MIFAHLSIVYLHVCPPPGLSSRSTQTRVDCLPSLNSIIIHNIIGKTVDENGLVFSSTTDQPRTWGRLL